MKNHTRTLALALSLLLTCSLPALAASDGRTTAPSCQKRSAKEVKTVTPFTLSHRPNSKKVLYDDIVCGLKWRQKQCSSIQAAFDGGATVYDFNTKAEITINTATFVLSPAIKSPMSSGLAAFTTPAAAEAFVAKNPGAKQLSYPQLLLLEGL
jgi:hypothetical protein